MTCAAQENERERCSRSESRGQTFRARKVTIPKFSNLFDDKFQLRDTCARDAPAAALIDQNAGLVNTFFVYDDAV